MEPLDRQKILQENPNVTVEELDEYEQLLGRRFNDSPLNSEEIDRVFDLFHKIFPVEVIAAKVYKDINK